MGDAVRNSIRIKISLGKRIDRSVSFDFSNETWIIWLIILFLFLKGYRKNEGNYIANQQFNKGFGHGNGHRHGWNTDRLSNNRFHGYYRG